jgi:nondiscriminating aspartyl-tRNA synthetase
MSLTLSRTLVSAVPGLVGEVVRLQGWVARLRVLGGLTFVVLRERSGQLQLVLEKSVHAGLGLTPEAVIAVEGRVVANARAPGGVELHVTALTVLNPTQGQLPVEVGGLELSCGSETMIEQRVLTMRHPRQAAIFRVQAAIAEAFAGFLRAEGFLEFFSPKLIASGTEGGSELFEVSYFGRQAYLAQSPQLYKEMMVASGAERVFEIGHVYRAEPHETARHLNEYISLDVEVGFIAGESELMALETRLLQHIFAHLQATCASELALWEVEIAVPATIPTLTLAEALTLLESLGLPAGERGDLSPAGERLLCEHAAQHWGSEFVFVTAFPTASRPFYTMTQPEAPHLTKSFDLLYRGLEITSGGQRLHGLRELEAAMVMRGMGPSAFGPYLEAFKHGMPPHGGFAIGLERLTARILGLSNVREASLFPRTRHHLSP